MNDKNVILQVRGLQKNFGELEVLKGLDLDIHEGEVISIIGPSGCGKSTFLRCLNLLEKPDGGSICFEGPGGDRGQDRCDRLPPENRYGVPALQRISPSDGFE